MIRQCERPGCSAVHRRRRFCSDRCASIDRQQRYRARESLEFVEMMVSVTIEHSEPQAFGVPTIGDVAWSFADDKVRYRQMGYVG